MESRTKNGSNLGKGRHLTNKSNIVWALLGLFTLVNLGDLISSWFILPGEANPLFIYFQTPFVLYILKILLNAYIIYLVWNNAYKEEASYFLIIFILIYGSAMFGLGVASNINGILNPEVIEQASQIPGQERAMMYGIIVGALWVVPALFSFLTFEIYNRTKKFVNFQVIKKVGKQIDEKNKN